MEFIRKMKVSIDYFYVQISGADHRGGFLHTLVRSHFHFAPIFTSPMVFEVIYRGWSFGVVLNHLESFGAGVFL